MSYDGKELFDFFNIDTILKELKEKNDSFAHDRIGLSNASRQ